MPIPSRYILIFLVLAVSTFFTLEPSLLHAEPDPEKLSTVLSRLYTAKKYDEALTLCRQYLATHDGRMPDGGLSLLFGKVLLKSDKADDWTLAGRALRWSYVSDERLREEGLYYLAESYYKRRFYDEAVYSYERFLLEFPRSVYADGARLKAGESMVKTGRFETAVPLFKDLLTVAGYETKARLGLLKAHAAMNRYDLAATHLDLMTREDVRILQEDEEALVAAASTDEARGRFEEARFYVDSLEKLYPRSESLYRGYLVMARIMFSQRRGSESRQYFELASQSPGTEAEAGLGLMRLDMEEKDYKAVLDKGQVLLEKYPYFRDRQAVSMLMGRSYESMGDINRALTYYGDAASSPDLIRMLLGVRQKDAKAFLEAYSVYRDKVSHSMEIGEALIQDGAHVEEARAIFKSLLMGPEQNRALMNLARSYMAVGLEGLARDFLADLIQRGVKDDDAFRTYGALTAKVGRYDVAMSALQKISAKTGADWRLIGSIYEQTGRQTEALKSYGEAILLGDGESYLVRAEIYRRMGKHDLALADYREAAKACKSDQDKLWATYQAGVLSGEKELIKAAAGWGPGMISQVARVVAQDQDFKEKYGRNRAIK